MLLSNIYKEELREIEEETIFLLNCKGPHVLLNRNQFFLLLFTILSGHLLCMMFYGQLLQTSNRVCNSARDISR